jgi:type IV secretory pathway VirB10-like protein
MMNHAIENFFRSIIFRGLNLIDALDSTLSISIEHLTYISLYIEKWRLMMNNQIIKLFVVILSGIFLFSSLAVAGGKGKGKNKTQPPGWEQGEKTGWKGEDTPPGLTEEKLQKKQKAPMKGDEAKAKAQEEGEKAEQETELQEEKTKQEAEIQKQKKKREAEMKNEQEKLKSPSKKKKG